MPVFITTIYKYNCLKVYRGVNNMKEKSTDTSCMTYYKKSAENWLEAFPLGCGSRGAMVLGGCEEENILLNQDTFWAGLPGMNDFKENGNYINVARRLIDEEKYIEANEFVEKYMTGERPNAYMPLGYIKIKFGHKLVSEYVRRLDLSKAIYSCDYKVDNIKYHREGFCSHPHMVFAQKFICENKSLSFTVTMDSEVEAETFVEDGYLKLSGCAPIHIVFDSDEPAVYDTEGDCNRFQAWLWVETDGDKVYGKTDISIKNASYAILYQVSDTSFVDWKSMPRKDPSIECKYLMQKVHSDGYENIKKEHIADYTGLFSRVELTLEKNENSTLPTDERIKKFTQDMSDNEFCALYYNFGRYLAISSQRQGSMPANLQGIWSWKVKPEWGCDWHLNINLQMNYWCSENANLSECRMSLLEWLKGLCESGKKTACNLNACRGSCAYQISNLWNKTTPDLGNPVWAYWPMGEAWLAMDIFDHYEYTKDIKFLAEYFDVLKANALFLYDWLYFDDELGYYVTSPSTSPEHNFLWETENGRKEYVAVSKATTCDLSIIREIFCDFIKASEILDCDREFANEIAERLKLLYPYKIGKKGELLEWFEDFEPEELGHRHMSHMLGVYPGSFINETDTPDLFRAVKKSLEIRIESGGYSGWSCVWALAFFAKFRDTEGVSEYINRLFSNSTSSGLLDLYPPNIFQIEGNFGAVAAFGEMLLQSDNGIIDIFPCIPDFIKNGKVKGIRAKGGVTFNGEWENGRLKYAEITPDFDGEYILRYDGKSINIAAEAGKCVKVF